MKSHKTQLTVLSFVTPEASYGILSVAKYVFQHFDVTNHAVCISFSAILLWVPFNMSADLN